MTDHSKCPPECIKSAKNAYIENINSSAITSRRIPLKDFHAPDPRVTAWMRANDVDPNHVVAASYALILDEKVLALVGFQIKPDGKKAFDAAVQGVIKVPIVVPMKSAPEEHGL